MPDSYYPRHGGEQSPGSEELRIAWLEDRVEFLTRQRDEARAEVERLTALTEESEHQMHLRIRAGYDKTVADAWRAALAKMERERDEARAALSTVAERQREACADYVRLWRLDPRMGAIHWHSEDAVHATPLVTEGDK